VWLPVPGPTASAARRIEPIAFDDYWRFLFGSGRRGLHDDSDGIAGVVERTATANPP